MSEKRNTKMLNLVEHSFERGQHIHIKANHNERTEGIISIFQCNIHEGFM
jgi:hypothetical protein